MMPGDQPAWRWRLERKMRDCKWQGRPDCLVSTDDLQNLLDVFDRYEAKVAALHAHIGELEEVIVHVRKEAED